MAFRQDFIASRVATLATRGSLDILRRDASAALARLLAAQGEGRGPRFLDLPSMAADRAALEREAAALRARFRHLVVIGTGGSNLGAQAIAGALAPGFVKGDHRLSFLDNVDPAAVGRALDAMDLAETGFLAISKSGNTAETLALVLSALDRLPRDRAGEQFRFVIEPGDSPLRRLALRLGAPVLDHDPKLGGRFSVLSLVGLLPSLFLGLDAWALRAGAQQVLEDARRGGVAIPAPAESAARTVALARESGVGTLVLMFYGDALDSFGLWWRQLVGESLGKEGLGFTPIASRGTTDQHSQLQLYLAGPADKSFTVLSLAPPANESRFDAGLAATLGISYLGDRSLGALFAAEAEATARTLADHGRPVRRLVLDTLDAATLGGLFMHFMLEVVLMAELLGINAYDQPAVEHGKVLVRQLLGEAAP